MNLQDWSNVAQVIGALAVVISLVYVGFQVKRNTNAVRSATSQAVHNNYADWYMSMVGDAELNRIAIKGLKDYSLLDEIEKARFIETFMAFTALSSVSNATERICGSELFGWLDCAAVAQRIYRTWSRYDTGTARKLVSTMLKV
jgi:hypothetical protein